MKVLAISLTPVGTDSAENSVPSTAVPPALMKLTEPMPVLPTSSVLAGMPAWRACRMILAPCSGGVDRNRQSALVLAILVASAVKSVSADRIDSSAAIATPPFLMVSRNTLFCSM